MDRNIRMKHSQDKRFDFAYGDDFTNRQTYESISQEVPVVVSDIPSTKWARLYNNSYFYPTEDIDACADAILRALSNRWKKTNSAEIIDRYGIDQWCDKAIQIYRTIK